MLVDCNKTLLFCHGKFQQDIRIIEGYIIPIPVNSHVSAVTSDTGYLEAVLIYQIFQELRADIGQRRLVIFRKDRILKLRTHISVFSVCKRCDHFLKNHFLYIVLHIFSSFLFCTHSL